MMGEAPYLLMGEVEAEAAGEVAGVTEMEGGGEGEEEEEGTHSTAILAHSPLLDTLCNSHRIHHLTSNHASTVIIHNNRKVLCRPLWDLIQLHTPMRPLDNHPHIIKGCIINIIGSHNTRNSNIFNIHPEDSIINIIHFRVRST